MTILLSSYIELIVVYYVNIVELKETFFNVSIIQLFSYLIFIHIKWSCYSNDGNSSTVGSSSLGVISPDEDYYSHTSIIKLAKDEWNFGEAQFESPF